MSELERLPGGTPVGRGPSGLARRANDVKVAGEAVHYSSMAYSEEEAWVRLSPSMRTWAEEHAGETIKDPHTGVRTVYWCCEVDPVGTSGPGLAGVTASYELVLFGKRGLVVSNGSTDAFVDAPGATAWRHNRFALAVDPAGVRSDHRIEAAEGRVPGTPYEAQPRSAPLDALPANLLNEVVAGRVGNLPVPTQRFLLEPFLNASVPPKAGVHCRTRETGGEFRETFWTYVFNARWLAFAYSVRAVPLRSGLSGPVLWNDSPERTALDRAPWAVSAWVAPVHKAGSAVASR